jgi:alpha-L-fucosidase
MLRRDEFYPGSPGYKQLTQGHEDGTHWVPAEVDVSIRPGWYYHQSEDHKVKSLKQLVDIYYNSIGRNASFLLNFPVDQRGLIHEKDVEQLNRMAEQIRSDFRENLATEMGIEASHVRGNHRAYKANRVLDRDPETYWTTDDTITSASLVLDFEEPTDFNRFVISEYIALGQRVKAFSVESWKNGAWYKFIEATTIGRKRILRFPTQRTEKIRVNILDSRACPVISEIGIYNAPKLLAAPAIYRDKEGVVSIEAFDEGLEIYYTTDGSDPSANSIKYSDPFTHEMKLEIHAIAYDPATKKGSAATIRKFDIAKMNWKVIKPAEKEAPGIMSIIDDNDRTVWASDKRQGLPAEIIIDLGKPTEINGFTYLPNQGRWIGGTIMEYEVYVSLNGKNWKQPVSKGEFSNIKNNPILQSKTFDKVEGQFLLFKALKEINSENFASIAELGIITP